MRIVDVNEFYSPTGGGVRTYIDRKMGIMADLGHELIVIAPGKENRVEERPGGGKVIWIQTGHLPLDQNYGIFWEAPPILNLLDALQADVVETSSPWRLPWIIGKWQPKYEGGAVKAFFMHNDNMAAYALRWLENMGPQDRLERAFGWYSRYMSRFLAHFDTVVTNGPALEKRLRNRGVHIDAAMPLGIERGHFSPDLRDERLRAALLAQCDLPPTGHLLLGLGRHHPEKRWRLVIDAAERAGSDLPVGLILLGAGVESRQIEMRIAGSPHIRMFRPVYDRERLARIVASCDALIHGSEAEPFGLVASEAMAGGLPLIVPDTGGCAEVADKHASEFYTARDAQSAAMAIHRLFARDQRVLRRAALVAAGKVRSDRDHAVELMDYYQAQVDLKRSGKRLRAAA
ncbi:glycosyltransferase [Sphingomonas sp. MMS24-J45]|uniref:glycosyltransferase n=1 Tax=Sphingomonas sp. MMS24-J45 TaxID=3238806 RepID=UPI00384D6858